MLKSGVLSSPASWGAGFTVRTFFCLQFGNKSRDQIMRQVVSAAKWWRARQALIVQFLRLYRSPSACGSKSFAMHPIAMTAENDPKQRTCSRWVLVTNKLATTPEAPDQRSAMHASSANVYVTATSFVAE